MRKLLLNIVLLAATALVFLGGHSSPAPAAADRATLEGVVHCTSDRPMVVSVEPKTELPSKPTPGNAVIDQRGLTFSPHVLPVLVGTRVAFLNSDPVRHNVFSASPTKPFNLGTYPSGVIRHVTFDRPGVVDILCNVHPEMGAYVVVLETPFFTVTDEELRYRIEGLPAGAHTVSVWCEVNGSRQQEIRLDAGPTRLDFDMREKAVRDVGRPPIDNRDALLTLDESSESTCLRIRYRHGFRSSP